MSAGWQIGAKCLPSIEAAGSEACSMAFGVTGSGVLSCTAFEVAGSSVNLSMSTGAVVSVTPQECDRITYADTWGPLFGVLLVATVVIWGLKKLLLPFRTHDDV